MIGSKKFLVSGIKKLFIRFNDLWVLTYECERIFLCEIFGKSKSNPLGENFVCYSCFVFFYLITPVMIWREILPRWWWVSIEFLIFCFTGEYEENKFFTRFKIFSSGLWIKEIICYKHFCLLFFSYFFYCCLELRFWGVWVAFLRNIKQTMVFIDVNFNYMEVIQ